MEENDYVTERDREYSKLVEHTFYSICLAMAVVIIDLFFRDNVVEFFQSVFK
jgi:hypothetical protein